MILVFILFLKEVLFKNNIVSFEAIKKKTKEKGIPKTHKLNIAGSLKASVTYTNGLIGSYLKQIKTITLNIKSKKKNREYFTIKRMLIFSLYSNVVRIERNILETALMHAKSKKHLPKKVKRAQHKANKKGEFKNLKYFSFI